MKTPKIIIRHVIKELFLYSLFAVFLITFLLVMANLLRHEDSVFWILRKSNQSLLGFILLLVPYALSMAIPFGFAVALSYSLGKWSSSKGNLGIEFSWSWQCATFLADYYLQLIRFGSFPIFGFTMGTNQSGIFRFFAR